MTSLYTELNYYYYVARHYLPHRTALTFLTCRHLGSHNFNSVHLPRIFPTACQHDRSKAPLAQFEQWIVQFDHLGWPLRWNFHSEFSSVSNTKLADDDTASLFDIVQYSVYEL